MTGEYARQHIFFEQYAKRIHIEARAASSLAKTHILPAALRYQAELAGNIASKGATAIFVGSMEVGTSLPIKVESEDSLRFRGNRFQGRDGEDNPVLVVWGGERIQAGRRLARGTTTLT